MPEKDWAPKTPPLESKFAKAQGQEAEQRTQEPAELDQGISTKAEMDHLAAIRTTPKLETHLTIGGSVQRIVNDMTQQNNNLREAYLKRSLERAGQTLRKDFERNR